MRYSFAQNFEDVLLHRCFAGRSEGFYVDVGAAAPVLHNVSLNFYLAGWRGLHVEPIPERAAELRFARPRDIVVEAAASDARARVTLHRTAGGGGLSSLTSEYYPANLSEREVWPLEIEARPLADMLAEHGVERIDFLKIDVEGAEARTIAGMDWRRWRPAVTVIEAVTPTRPPRPHHESWEPTLTRNGYAFVWFDGLNRYYLAEEARALQAHFATPPNAFDPLRRYEDFGEPLLNRAHPANEFATRTAKALLRGLAAGGVDIAAILLRDYAPTFLAEPTTQAHAEWAVRQMLAREPREGEARGLVEGKSLTVRQMLDAIFASDEFRAACAMAAA